MAEKKIAGKDEEEVYKNFKNALEKYLNKKYERNLIDDLRLSLELLLKEILKKDRVSLKKKEDQKLILKELKNKGYREDVRNMIRQLLIYYESYQNEYVKHNDKVNPLEIEFMIYLTRCFIRLLNR